MEQIRSRGFPGCTSDAGTVKKDREDLGGWKLGRARFVADSGTNSATRRDELARAFGKYPARRGATRLGNVGGIKEDILTRVGRSKTVPENSEAREAILGDGVLKRRYILS